MILTYYVFADFNVFRFYFGFISVQFCMILPFSLDHLITNVPDFASDCLQAADLGDELAVRFLERQHVNNHVKNGLEFACADDKAIL